MKKTLMALVATTMLAGFSAPSFAGINPANIDESSSAANIYKVIDKKVAKGTNAGVVGLFAWANVNGEIYSVALNDLRKYSDPSAAFVNLIGAEIEAGALEAAIDSLPGQISEAKDGVIEMLVAGGVDSALLDAANAEIELLETQLELAVLREGPGATASDIAAAEQAVRDSYADYVSAAGVVEAERLARAAGVASVDITTDNQMAIDDARQGIIDAARQGIIDMARMGYVTDAAAAQMVNDVTAGDISVTTNGDATVRLSNGNTATVSVMVPSSDDGHGSTVVVNGNTLTVTGAGADVYTLLNGRDLQDAYTAATEEAAVRAVGAAADADLTAVANGDHVVTLSNGGMVTVSINVPAPTMNAGPLDAYSNSYAAPAVAPVTTYFHPDFQADISLVGITDDFAADRTAGWDASATKAAITAAVAGAGINSEIATALEQSYNEGFEDGYEVGFADGAIAGLGGVRAD